MYKRQDTYSYQAEDLWADVLTGYNGQKFTYDEIGNPLTYRDGMGFTWQYGRQMSGAVTEEEAISYWYNADGIRTKKFRSNGEVTDYYLNGSNIITMITNSVMDPENPRRLDFYYDEQGTLLGFQYNGQDYWYIQNGQGDIVGILDSTGAQVVSYAYDSWGVPISTTGSMADTIGEINPFRYRGYYYDSETGLYYLNSRYYDPVVGRFINMDSAVITNNEALYCNIYIYCANNPIGRRDSSGCSFFDVPLSMADRMQMSQSMLDSYYAAKNAAQNSSAIPEKPSVLFDTITNASVGSDALNLSVKDQTKLTHRQSSTGQYYFNSVPKYPNTTKGTKIISKVAVAASAVSTAWDMGTILTNNQLNNNQKALGCGIAAGSFAANLGVGALAAGAFNAIVAVNCWNPVGWGLALGAAAFLAISVIGTLVVNYATESAYKGIGVTI